MDAWTLIAYVFWITGPFVQTYRIWQTGDSKTISLGWLIFQLAGLGIFVPRLVGSLEHNTDLFWGHLTVIFSMLILLGTALWYRRFPRRSST